MSSQRLFGVVLLVLAFSLFGGACVSGVGPNGGVVGSTCSQNSQCANECITGDNHYPGGYCTVPCVNDSQCPANTACIDDHGGICAFACRTNDDCAPFGRGFVCDARDRHGAAGGTLVCRVP